jgi:Domain of unknown function (DUF5615)
VALLNLDADLDPTFGPLFSTAGHDVLATRQAGRLRAYDEEQLAFAAGLGRVVLTHNRADFLVLQRAWRHWSDIGDVEPEPSHAGILALPQPQHAGLSIEQMVVEIDAFLGSGVPLTNLSYEWDTRRGRIQKG